MGDLDAGAQHVEQEPVWCCAEECSVHQRWLWIAAAPSGVMAGVVELGLVPGEKIVSPSSAKELSKGK